MKLLNYLLASTVLGATLYGLYSLSVWINTPTPTNRPTNTTISVSQNDSDTNNASEQEMPSEEENTSDFWENSHLIPDSNVDVKTLTTTEKLAKAFEGLYLYYMPKIYIEQFPTDFSKRGNPELFIKAMMPLILHENNMILKERKLLLSLKDKLNQNIPWDETEKLQFNALIQKYGLTKEKLIAPQLDELLLRVDIIPPSLAMAMSGIQTNWGKKSLSAPFGQKEWINGVYTEKQFKTLGEATHAYVMELNTLPIYKSLWITRKNNKQTNQSLGEKLINSADNFMRENPDYERQIKKAFDQMHLRIMDTAILHE